MFYRFGTKTFFTVYAKNGKIIGYLKNFDSYTDKAVNESGIPFCKALTRIPQSLETLVNIIYQSFQDADIEIIKKDAMNFYAELENAGFIVSGNTVEETDKKDSEERIRLQQERSAVVSGTPIVHESGWSIMCRELGGNPLLLETQIELTNRCNERCVHCYLPMDDRKNTCDIDINPSVFYKFLDQAKEIGMLSIALTGGELMLHKNFLDFLKKTKEYGFSITLFSNLTLLTDEIIEELLTPQIIAIKISLYSMDANTHDKITGIKGSFEKTFSNIKKLMNLNIPVQINTPIMKQNQHNFMDVIRWGEENNIRVIADYKIFASYDLTGQQQLENRLSIKELEPVIKALFPRDSIYLTAKGEVPHRIRNFETDMCCGCCTCSFCMNASGDIYPCNGWQNYKLGNITEETLGNIISNSEKAVYIRNLRRTQFEKCLNCKDIDYCDFCLMRNALEDKNGNMLHLNKYYCQVAALRHRLIQEALENQKDIC